MSSSKRPSPSDPSEDGRSATQPGQNQDEPAIDSSDPATAPTSEVEAVRDPAARDSDEPSGERTSEPEVAAKPAEDPLTTARAEASRLKDQWMRTAADFDNFRKRARREVEEARKSGREDLLKELLPVFDNLERAIQSAQKATDVKGVADGLSMVIKQFTDTLARTGINKVPTVGNAFDPSVHEAIQQIETADHPAGTIVAEVQPGYVQGEKLVRAAMVVVAKPKSEATN